MVSSLSLAIRELTLPASMVASGREAFVVNNAQVCVLLAEDESLLVGAQVLAIQEELPITQEELKAGLIEIALQVVTEL